MWIWYVRSMFPDGINYKYADGKARYSLPEYQVHKNIAVRDFFFAIAECIVNTSVDVNIYLAY